jgi:hypothetical protein
MYRRKAFVSAWMNGLRAIHSHRAKEIRPAKITNLGRGEEIGQLKVI